MEKYYNNKGVNVPGMYQDGGQTGEKKEPKKYDAPGGEGRRKESDERYGKRHTRLREKGHKLMKKSDKSWDEGKEKKSDRQFKRGKRKFDRASKIRRRKDKNR